MVIKTLLITCLFFIFYQDLRYRAVYWIVFPFLLLLMIIEGTKNQTIFQLATNTGINLAFFLVQLILISAYFSIRHRCMINITTNYLGLGDILFLICISAYLSPLNYILFYVISLFAALCVALMQFLIQRKAAYKIPLAGLQAFFLAFTFLAEWNFKFFSLSDDSWLHSYLMPFI